MMPEPLFLCHPVLKLTTEVRELNLGKAMVLSVSVRNRMYLPVKTSGLLPGSGRCEAVSIRWL